MTVEEAMSNDKPLRIYALVERLLKRGRLTKIQEIVFRQSWAGQTYLDMAVESDYDCGYIKDTGSELWRSLSPISPQFKMIVSWKCDRQLGLK